MNHFQFPRDMRSPNLQMPRQEALQKMIGSLYARGDNLDVRFSF